MPNVSNRGELKAGVAKVQIEIPDILFPYPHLYSIVLTGVHDHLHVRTLLLDNGIEKAAIVEKFADGWFLGTNQYAPSDKSLAVIRVDRSDGSPMAFFINYAVHAVVMHQSLTDGEGGMLVSADLPGETSRYIEDWYDGKAVALWTSGAAGDQDPVYMCQRHTAKRNGDHTSINEHTRGYLLLEELGERLARETLKVSENIETDDAIVSIAGHYRVVTYPGQTGSREQPLPKDFAYKDGPPVDLKLSLIKINDIALTGINGELFSSIGQDLKEESPLRNTMVINHTRGSIGYLPDEFGYECRSFEARGAKVKRGHAEKLVISNLKAMIKELL